MKKQKIPMKEKISDELEISPSLPHIEIFANKEATVEGCKGVLQYDDGVIGLNAGKYTIRFTGTNLSMTSLGLEQAVIKGRIMEVEFI